MRMRVTWAALLAVGLCGGALAVPLPGTGPDKDKTVIYRDTWGVPHIYSPTVEGGLYAMGWAQAEDRPEELLKNLARGIGESALFGGPGEYLADLRALMWRHYEISKERIGELAPEVRTMLEAYVAGANDFYAAHPADVPAWWGDRKIDIYMVMAFGRMFLYNWSIDDAYEDLKRAGIEPGFEKTERASNQFAISPQRSAEKAPILYIDPHLGFFGVSRFWEFRIHAGALEGSGFGLPCMPYIGLGHNANVAWAMTTGGPDTADVYELTLDPANPLQYKYDDGWKSITQREVTIKAKGGEEKTFPIFDSHYGPIIAMRGGKAYAAKISYADCVRGSEAWYAMNFAKDYRGILAAIETQEIFPQNIMTADTSGNIYYQRTGRVPARPGGYDWTRPVDGSTSKTEWTGLEPVEAHVQILNPPSGYMQNCNISPDGMMMNSPMTLDKYKPELFTDVGYGPRTGWSNQRGARAVELLHNDASVTAEEAIQYALDLHPFGAERWVKILLEMHESNGAAYDKDADYQAGIADLKKWDFQLKANSTAALKYYYWRKQLMADHGEETMTGVTERIDQLLDYVHGKERTWPEFGGDEAQAGVDSFSAAMQALKSDYGKLDATYGDKFRIGRDDKSWPSSGGGDRPIGMTTLRNVNYSKDRDDKTRWAVSGQTSTQIVVLTQPIQSWTQPPIGQSDRPDSPHYRDQAEKLFSKVEMKPTWWLPKDLKKNIASRTELPNAPK